MHNLKLMSIIGARPQFIKAAIVSRLLREEGDIDEILVHTGQHYDHNMSRIFFDELEIREPEVNLGIGGGNHGEQTGKMIVRIEELMLENKPDLVLVYGDTNSTLAGSLAAAKLHIPLAHVEAGLRSYNKQMPEEINRILTDHVSDILFTPSDTATQNLLKEGIDAQKIDQVGDVMYDATLYYQEKAENQSDVLSHLKLKPKSYSLVTIHREENTDNPERLLEIFKSLENLAKSHKLILPLHPRTRKQLEASGFDKKRSLVQFIDPVGYLDMLLLEKFAKVIITDSGGIQKEAYFQDIPCVTRRK